MSVVVDAVSVSLGSAAILHDVSLEVAEGEVVAVLGPSGSGKTTLLRVIAGLIEPTRGRVLIDGRDVTRIPAHRRGVGIVFQDHALFPHRDVGGNVGFGLRMAGEGRRDIARRVDEVLELVGLGGFRRRRVDRLSGGERQRVALARALAPRPSILLLDEPLGALDRALRDRLLEDLGDVLRAAGVTAVHVTHDQAEAFATGNRIAVVRDGRIVQLGPPEELWRRPWDAHVARIVGPAGIVPVEVSEAGTIGAPWGPLGADVVATGTAPVPGPALLVLRPDALEVVDPTRAGARHVIPGRVAARAYRGDHVLARVVPEGAGPDVELPVVDRHDATGAAGSSVALAIIPGAATLVPAPSGDDPPP